MTDRIKALEDALRKLELANDRVCGARSQRVYNLMIASGMSDALLELDCARAEARAALAASQPAPETLNAAYNRGYEDCLYSAGQTAEPESRPITLTYTNWKGETAQRTIIPRHIWWGSTEWHPEPQWLLTAFDVDKGSERDFALKDFGQPAQPVAVKPLVWDKLDDECYSWKAPLFGAVLVKRHWKGHWVVVWSTPGYTGLFVHGQFHTRDDAKAAAEARIMAALDVQPLTVQDAARRILSDDIAISHMAQALHDGPLGADDYWFSASRPQGGWCVDAVRVVLRAIAEGRE